MSNNENKIIVLGKSFNSDEERRSYFREELRKKLPELRKLEGFPIGEDEDILNLSDAPYYTSCPNPFLSYLDNSEAIKGHRVELPYAKDFTVDQRHPVYLFHPYHTKVPPSIIKTLIEHYTHEGDVVLDIFGGSGMTAVAAREANRRVISNDLSTVASFISGVNSITQPARDVIDESERILAETLSEFNWMYKIQHGNYKMDLNYSVWSDVFSCPNCTHEFPFFPHGVIHHGNKVETRKEFNCPNCDVNLNIRKIERVINHFGKKKKIVWVNAGSGNKRVNREADAFDAELVEKIEDYFLNYKTWFPKDSIDPNGYSAKLAQLGNKSINDISKFLSTRNLIVYSDLWDRMLKIQNVTVRNGVKSILTSIFTVISERQGYFGGGGGMSGNLYMPVVRMEKNVFESFKRKLKKYKESELKKPKKNFDHFITNQSSTDLSNISTNSIDYIYTDPPFGANIIYSEMNLLLEGWLKVKTNDFDESVIDESKDKGFFDYGKLMTKCFKECYRVLKPGSWMSVEFHNTKAAIWNLIQTSISESGFIVAQVNKLDKGSTTILADIRPGAAVQDLIISCYKPTSEFDDHFKQIHHKEIGVWEFVKEHLNHLPIILSKEKSAYANIERTSKILFDRLVAFYVQRGQMVPIDAGLFRLGLKENFVERDSMFFNVEQVQEYDKLKKETTEFVQLSLLISTEEDGVIWLKNILEKKACTYQEIQPLWMQSLAGLRKGDILPELITILEEHFLKNENNEWYAPDAENEAHLEKLRTKRLLKDFDTYKEICSNPRSKLNDVRVESLRAGFKQCYQDKDFKSIVTIGDRIPNNLLMEDEVLLQFYDIASSRI
jgi:DNA modification methylase